MSHIVTDILLPLTVIEAAEKKNKYRSNSTASLRTTIRHKILEWSYKYFVSRQCWIVHIALHAHLKICRR